ncbi:MAG: IS21 family transposase [Actinomycetota bacterium]|nr:IS21 family transposase [Actinomycetota bacterium]
MLKLIDKQKIIIKYFNEGFSKRKIERELHISRKTIRRYIDEYEKKKSQLMEQKAEDIGLITDICQKPRYNTSNRAKVKLNEQIIQRINFFLKENQNKKASGRSKQVMKKIDIHEALISEGFDIGYTTVCCAITDIAKQSKEAFIRQEHIPGQTAEFDWGEVKLIIGQKQAILQMSVFTTAYGNYCYADLYCNQKTESFLDSHANFFEEVGGIHKEILYDNARTVIARFVGRNHKEPTGELLKLSAYYNFSFRFCNISRANEKGHVERSVEYVRRKVFSRRDKFESLDAARLYLKEKLVELNQKPQILLNGSTAMEMLNVERAHLYLKPPRYDCARKVEARVNKYSCIGLGGCYYSVPDSFVGEFVTVKAYPDRIICFYKDEMVASHKRLYGNHEWKVDINHYIRTLKIKPGALAQSTAFAQMESSLKNIYNKYFIGSEKRFVELLEMAGEIGLAKIEDAVAELEEINPGLVDLDKIIVICSRKKESFECFRQRENSQIEKSSREMLFLYSQMLESCHSFEEVKV